MGNETKANFKGVTIMARGAITDEGLLIAAARAKAHMINSIAATFYARRLELGLREEDVAIAIGSSQSRISAFERADGNPTIETIARLAAVLGLDVEVAARAAVVRTAAAAPVTAKSQPRKTRPFAASVHVDAPMAAKGR
jgi:DNA-binding XRE family transcriptional regulator